MRLGFSAFMLEETRRSLGGKQVNTQTGKYRVHLSDSAPRPEYMTSSLVRVVLADL